MFLCQGLVWFYRGEPDLPRLYCLATHIHFARSYVEERLPSSRWDGELSLQVQTKCPKNFLKVLWIFKSLSVPLSLFYFVNLFFPPQVEERKDFHKETSASKNTNVRVSPSLTGSSELGTANSLEDLMVLESRARPQTRDTHRKLRHIHILPTVDRLPLYRLITVSSFCLSLSYVCLQSKKN